MLISICIPTYNRPDELKNCLNSLSLQTNLKFEVCISDNCSKTNVASIVEPYRNKLNIKFSKNDENLGAALNFLKAASMATNEFIWFLGDDDLLIPNAVEDLTNLINQNKDCDFFWINSFHLNANFLKKFKKPFDTHNLPKKMMTLSNKRKSEKMMFFDLIRHSISFDYLLAAYTSVFKRKGWAENQGIINKQLIKDKNPWSNFDNTCFHIKIFCEAFNNSKVYFYSTALSVNLHGIREWKDIYPMIEIIRIPEALDYYRSKGMSFFQYIYEKNYSLRNFFNYYLKVMINSEKNGYKFANYKKQFLKNLIYPNSWLSILYFLVRKLKNILNFKNKKI